MLVSDVVRCLAQAGTAGLLLTDTATVGRVVVLQAVYGAAEAFFRPAALGLVPQLVRPHQLQAANATLGLADNLTMVAGPAAAGLLVATVGPGWAVAVDAATFGVSACALSLLRPRPVRRDRHRRFGADLRNGFREVTSRTWLWSVLLAFAVYHALVLSALFVLGPAYAQDHRGGAMAWGIISAGFGLGGIVGSVLAIRWRPARPGVLLVAGLCLGSTQAALVVSALPTVAVAAAEAVTGVGVAVCFTVWDTVLQREVPEEAQSRVSSFDYLACLTLMPVGYLLVGPLADQLGTRLTAVAASVISLAVGAAVAASRDVRRLARDAQAPLPPGAASAVPSRPA
jgi:MFS family permease